MGELRNGKTYVTGSQKVAEEDSMYEIGSERGIQNGIEEKVFASDGKSALQVEREPFIVKVKANNMSVLASLGKPGLRRL